MTTTDVGGSRAPPTRPCRPRSPNSAPRVRTCRCVRTWRGSWASDGAKVFATVELDPRTIKQPDWGGDVAHGVHPHRRQGRAGARAGDRPTAIGAAALTRRGGADTGGRPAGPVTTSLRARVTPTQGGLPLTDSVRFSVPEGRCRRSARAMFGATERDDGAGVRADVGPAVHAGPTGCAWCLPLAAPGTVVSAELVDQRGQTMSLPVTGSVSRDGETDVAVAELSLAPLAAGEYAVKVVDRHRRGQARAPRRLPGGDFLGGLPDGRSVRGLFPGLSPSLSPGAHAGQARCVDWSERHDCLRGHAGARTRWWPRARRSRTTCLHMPWSSGVPRGSCPTSAAPATGCVHCHRWTTRPTIAATSATRRCTSASPW